MARIDVYLRNLERLGAAGAVIASGQAVTFRFPTGDRHANQVTPHDQVVAMVREVASPVALDAIDSNRPASFELDSGGVRYVVKVQPRAGAWTVGIEPAGAQSAAPPAPGPGPNLAAPAAPPSAAPSAAVPSAPTVSAGGGDGELMIERTAYDARPRAAAGGLGALIASAREARASDVVLIADCPPMMRVAGELAPMPGREAWSSDLIEREALPLAPPELRLAWAQTKSAMFVASAFGGRLRVVLGREVRGTTLAVRLHVAQLPSLEALGLPASAVALLDQPRGLVVLAGARGAGVTTTRAVIVEQIAARRGGHVVSIAAANEILHAPARAAIAHRDLGEHAGLASEAIGAALGEGADVIAVTGQDPKTLVAAVAAAEAGAWVLLEVPAASLGAAVRQISDAVARERGGLPGVAVAACLLGGIAQTWPRKAGRGPSFEVLAVGHGLAARSIAEGTVS